MLKIDLHTHTLNSKCGNHTMWEVLNIASRNQMELVAITDHGPALGATVRGSFFFPGRVPAEYDGVKILKGMEANIVDLDGATDIPPSLLKRLDIVLAGLHAVFPGEGVEANTRAVLGLLERGPAVDVIAHPDIRAYPLDLERVVAAAAERGAALELNNANLALDKTDLDQARRLIELGRKHGALFALNSDGHTWAEFGRDEEVRRLLRDLGSPALDIINDWPVERVVEHFAARKRLRAPEE